MVVRSRSRSRKNDAAQGIALGGLGLLLIAVLIGAYWWTRSRHETLDQTTNCPVSGPREVHIVLFDRTDPITQQQAQRIRQRMDQLRHGAKFGVRFDLYAVEGDSQNALIPILTICSPNRPEDANALIENPDFIKKRYQQRFVSVLDKTITSLLENSTRDTSPIIESIKAAAITSFGPYENRNIPFRLTIASDMVQHTRDYSNFRTEPNFATLEKSAAWRMLHPNLFDAQVDVLYLQRPSALRGGTMIQNRGHQLFWEQLIKASNGHFAPDRAFDVL